LAFGFDEADCAKSMSLVEIDGNGQTTMEIIPFEPIRRVRVLRGRHAELRLAERSEDFIKVVLTDDSPVIDGMKRIREVFPNACELIYERDERAPEIKALAGRTFAVANPVEVIGDFLEHVRDQRLSEDELAVVASTLGRLRETEDAE
jgi:exonuclease SbcD